MTGWFIDHFFLEMNGVFSNRDLISLLWDEWHLSGDAISVYKVSLLRNFCSLFRLPSSSAFRRDSPFRFHATGRYCLVLRFFASRFSINVAKTGALLFPVPYSLVSTAALLTLGVGGNRPFGYFTAQNIDRNRVIAAPVQRSPSVQEDRHDHGRKCSR